MAKFDTWLKSQRLSGALTQVELGKLLGIPQGMISKWESGMHKPSWKHIHGLETVFGPLAADVLSSIDIAPEGRHAEGTGEMQQPSVDAPNSGAVQRKRHPLFGSMKGTTIIMPGVDLTEPADPDWGKVYDDDYDHGVVAEPLTKTG